MRCRTPYSKRSLHKLIRVALRCYEELKIVELSFIIAPPSHVLLQLKSLERRVNRYKTLLGEDVIHKDDDITQLREDVSTLRDTLKSRESELDQKTQELQSSSEELSQVKTILDSFHQRFAGFTVQ